MNKTKTLSLVLLLLAGTGFIFGTFGFTNVSVERGVSVEVANDNHAFVGYQSGDQTVEDGETIELATVGNRFSHAIDVTDTTIDDGTFTISSPTQPTNIHPGETGTIRGTVECTPNEAQKIELTMTLKRSDVTAQIFGDNETRNFTLRCAPKTEETPQTPQ